MMWFGWAMAERLERYGIGRVPSNPENHTNVGYLR
jgi:hypothetical protein